jgi:hypothetical protein
MGGALMMALPSFASGPVVGAAVTVPRQETPTPGASPSVTPTQQQKMAYCQTFERTLADKLKVSQTDLANAQKAAIHAALQQAIADGTITQAKASAIEQNVAQNGFCSGMGHYRKHGGTPTPGGMGTPPSGTGTTTP